MADFSKTSRFPFLNFDDKYPDFKHLQNMYTGTVLFFNESKGYGFIKPDEAIASNSGCKPPEQTSIFVHITGLLDKIKANDRVEFNVVQGKNGLNAVHVKKIDVGAGVSVKVLTNGPMKSMKDEYSGLPISQVTPATVGMKKKE